MKYKEILGVKVFKCNCGEIFADRFSLARHIANKRKGKYAEMHYGGDFVSGNRTGLIAFVRKFVKKRIE